MPHPTVTDPMDMPLALRLAQGVSAFDLDACGRDASDKAATCLFDLVLPATKWARV